MQGRCKGGQTDLTRHYPKGGSYPQNSSVLPNKPRGWSQDEEEAETCVWGNKGKHPLGLAKNEEVLEGMPPRHNKDWEL